MHQRPHSTLTRRTVPVSALGTTRLPERRWRRDVSTSTPYVPGATRMVVFFENWGPRSITVPSDAVRRRRNAGGSAGNSISTHRNLPA